MGSGVLKGDRRIQRIHLSGVVGVFHLSCKIADLSLIAVSQYQENISPISGDHPRLHALEQFHCVRGDDDCVYAGGTASLNIV